MADRYTLQIDQGATYSVELDYSDPEGAPIDLSGYSAALQIRASYEADDTLADLSDGDGITLNAGGVDGRILIEISAAETALLQAGVWDLELDDGAGNITRLLEGKVKVSPEVTRA